MTATADHRDVATDAGRWERAGQVLLGRLIAELCYEGLLTPTPVDVDAASDASTDSNTGTGTGSNTGTGTEEPPDQVGRGPTGRYLIDTGRARYRFTARRGTFGTYWLDGSSLTRDAAPATDPAAFILDARDLLGWPGDTVADVIRELTATQAADVVLAGRARPAAELADLGFAELEGRSAGHPCIVANKGRLGFCAADAARYAPEAGAGLRLRWIAADPALVRPRGGPDLPSRDLLRAELDPATRAEFTAAAPADHVWLPVHPWQWENVVRPLFAPELAAGRLVVLGEAPDRHLPLASIRTVANADRPDRHHVKLAMMIRNTLVWRGLGAADVAAGPPVSRWLVELARADPYLVDTGVLPLAEVAGVALAHPRFDAVPDAPYRFHELVAALWRTSVEAELAPDERARSLAALLLVGSDGRALVTELVERGGLPARVWLHALLDALLPPLLHYLYGYGVAFTPHGENVIVVFGPDDVPRRIAVKDFGADLELVEGEFPERAGLPDEAAAHCRLWPGELLAHSILSALVAGHLRFFAVLVADHLGVAETDFWRLVRDTVDAYQLRFPHLADRFAVADLLAPTFGRVCLNREQFAGAGFHDRSERDAGFDVIDGQVANPLWHVRALPPPRPDDEDLA